MSIKKGLLRYFFTAGILLLAFLSFNQTAFASAETIDSFDAKITIEKNGAINVSEAIQYNFGSNQKHGVYRDVPLTSKLGPRLSIEVVSVNDESGQPYDYTTSTIDDFVKIKIGDPDVLISGIKNYIINYRVYNAIRSFEDHDELYWNATGTEWPVMIRKANVSIVLPDPNIKAKMDCFTGVMGGIEKNCVFNQSGMTVNYSATEELGVGEGLTFVLGWPLGYTQNTYVQPSTVQSSTTSTEKSSVPLIVFAFIFSVILLFVVAMVMNKRSSKIKPQAIIPKELKNQPIVVEYSPPDNLSPIELGTIADRRVDMTDITSVIMGLAVRGYLKIKYTEKKVKFWPDKKDFELIRVKDGSDLSQTAEKTIFELLFTGRASVTLSDLKDQKTVFQEDIKKITESIEKDLRDRGYFEAGDKAKKTKIYLVAVMIFSFFGFFIINILFDSFSFVYFWLLIGAMVVVAVIFMRLNNKLSAKGIATMAKILGFREFLQLTEKDKLKLLNAPDMKPETFEKFLAYAMVFGVEEAWAKKFEGIYNLTPDWYEDTSATGFNSLVLVHGLSSFSTSFNEVFHATSTSSSGFSGGSSGGGSGGGGGGSW
ncbi:MAG: DUF2207 domain-containing protein [Patescibacteria group bacterium]